MQLPDLRKRVKDRLDAADSNTDTDLRYSDELVERTIDEGYRDMVVRSGLSIATTTITSREYEFRYELPDDCVRVIAVRSTTDPVRKVHPTSVDDLDRRVPGWRKNTATRFEWYWIGPGLGEIHLGPASVTAGTEYTVTYEQDLLNSAAAHLRLIDPIGLDSTPLIPTRFQEALVDYAVGRLLLIGAREEGRIEMASAFLGDYESALKKLKRSVRRASGRNLHMDQSWVRDIR